MSTHLSALAETDGRAGSGAFRASALAASLTVQDLEKSLAWYRDVVGFTVDREYVREGKLLSVALRAGDVRILLNQDDRAKGAERV
ncbi:MAG TPA: VOC family protein, partial [Longimicrobiaceae bacterium]|nr:VOC family protein [Longimicrobiaceae bacterium]